MQKDTEQKILIAAEEEFIQKGMSGARMQEIANRAGINKALLHYYYRSKDKLFLAVFKMALSTFIPKVERMLASEDSVFDKIRQFVQEYGKVIMRNQFIPLFVMHEIGRNPEILADIVLSNNISPQRFIDQFEEARKNGEIIDVDPRHIIINMLSLIIFPVAGRPMLERIIFNNDRKEYQNFLKQRLDHVPDFIINSIKKK
ncbi:MAG: TetR/AcrR family transcriptional regulator [Bacteroidota bacterium]